MRVVTSRLQRLLGSVPDFWIFAAMTAYFLTITLLIPTQWFPEALGYPFSIAFLFGAVPLLVGLLRNTPSAIIAGFLMMSAGPFNQITVILGFVFGVYLGFVTLWMYRNRLRELFTSVFVERGFYLLLAVVGYIALVWLIRLGDTTDGWSFLALASSLLTVPLAAYSLSYLPWTEAEVRTAVKYVFFIGLAIAAVGLSYPAITGQYEQYSQALFVAYKALRVVIEVPMDMEWIDPDFNRAGFSSSHYFAAWMLIFAFGAAVAASVMRRRSRYAVMALAGVSLVGVYCFALGENAHILPGAITGVLSVALIAIVRRFSTGMVSALVLLLIAGGIAAVLGVLYFNEGRYSLSQKAFVYRSAADRITENPARMLLGDGPASFSSRAANKRLNHGAIEIEYSFPFGIPDFAPQPFKRTIIEAQAFEGGSTMKRTLTGLAGIVMEWGIFGTLLIAWLLTQLVGRAIRTWRTGESPEARIAAVAAVFGLVMITVSLSVRTYFEYAELASFVGVLFVLACVPVSGRSPGSKMV